MLSGRAGCFRLEICMNFFLLRLAIDVCLLYKRVVEPRDAKFNSAVARFVISERGKVKNF